MVISSMVSSAALHAKPPSIDPTRFARDASSLTGVLAPAQLPRVAMELFDQTGAIEYRIRGSMTLKDEPALRVELGIELALPCQRCMERLPVKLEVGRTLVLSREVEELESMADEADDVDSVPLVASLDLLDLIDQEVMLSLPISPRHDDGACEALPGGEPDSTRASPFSVLSQLKRT
jgi:DUF177 domain-containing protein